MHATARLSNVCLSLLKGLIGCHHYHTVHLHWAARKWGPLGTEVVQGLSGSVGGVSCCHRGTESLVLQVL